MCKMGRRDGTWHFVFLNLALLYLFITTQCPFFFFVWCSQSQRPIHWPSRGSCVDCVASCTSGSRAWPGTSVKTVVTRGPSMRAPAAVSSSSTQPASTGTFCSAPACRWTPLRQTPSRPSLTPSSHRSPTPRVCSRRWPWPYRRPPPYTKEPIWTTLPPPPVVTVYRISGPKARLLQTSAILEVFKTPPTVTKKPTSREICLVCKVYEKWSVRIGQHVDLL